VLAPLWLTSRFSAKETPFFILPIHLHLSEVLGCHRNIAHHLALLGCSVELITVVGKDPDGEWLEKISVDAGIRLNHIHRTESATGIYSSVLAPDGDLFIGAVTSDTDEMLNIDILAQRIQVLKNTKLVMADCNLATETLRWLISFCETEGIPIVIETVSVPKAFRLDKASPKSTNDETEQRGIGSFRWR
jgi:pseudouridine kinase